MDFLFDSRNSLFKSPFGCIEADNVLNLSCYVKDAAETGVLFLLKKDDGEADCYEMTLNGRQSDYNVYSLSLPFTQAGLFFYHFELQHPHSTTPVYRNGKNQPVTNSGSCWQITCYKREYPIPKDFCGKVMYQIFPDRFHKKGSCDTKEKLTPFFLHDSHNELPVFWPDENGIVQNNDFFGGNFQGIIEKLPYLKALGVQVIYLNPIFKAYSNHRYDTADYLQVDPLLGTNEDFCRLCDEAHKAGLRIILDGVFSHTGSDSLYFDIHNRFGVGARHNPNSPYRQWYQFTNYPIEYNTWWGISTLPCTDELNPDFQQFILKEVIPYWLSLGADGWRLDVADELPEEFLEKLYCAVKNENPEALVLGEVWEDASNKISYGVRRKYLQGKSLDSVMNYVWRDGIIRFVKNEISAADFSEIIMTLCENYPQDALSAAMNLLSTHDTPRILSVLGADGFPERKEEQATFRLTESQYKLAKNRLIVAAFLLFCLPGNICIYYGDEIGTEGLFDPFNRTFFGAEKFDESILHLFGALAALKNAHPSLQTGVLITHFATKDIFSFYRSTEDEKVLCIVNTGKTPLHFFLPGEMIFKEKARQNDQMLTLLPWGCAAIKMP